MHSKSKSTAATGGLQNPMQKYRDNGNFQYPPSAPPMPQYMDANENLPNATVVEPFEVMLMDSDGCEMRTVIPAGFQYTYINPNEANERHQRNGYDAITVAPSGVSTSLAEVQGHIMVRDEHNAVVDASAKAARYQAALQYQMLLNNRQASAVKGRDVDLTVHDYSSTSTASRASASASSSASAASYQRLHIPKEYVSSNDYDPDKELSRFSAAPTATSSGSHSSSHSNKGAAASGKVGVASGSVAKTVGYVASSASASASARASTDHGGGGYQPAEYECKPYEVSEYKSIYD